MRIAVLLFLALCVATVAAPITNAVRQAATMYALRSVLVPPRAQIDVIRTLPSRKPKFAHSKPARAFTRVARPERRDFEPRIINKTVIIRGPRERPRRRGRS
jgi:hypothetical protein